ncbi:hypothetical protein HB943_05970 [Listeria weihenstephanensis]|uniref:Uncharacterized protein n=1 Tax=Listeria weihenstephanensis TaxID=1006155 RepID=A0A841Z4G6_9LIST|nr:hypothetical protein [Listeria weihenstephanensis]MBC1500145.1 hypothetical protein [Listeria weihenstephanensis]
MRDLLNVQKQQFRRQFRVKWWFSTNSLYLFALNQDIDYFTIVPIRRILATCEVEGVDTVGFADAGFKYSIINKELVEKLRNMGVGA